MLPDRVSNPGPLTYESGALPIAPLGPAIRQSAFMGWTVLKITTKILHVGTNRSKQTVQTLIRLLPKEQSDQGLHCLPLCLLF